MEKLIYIFLFTLFFTGCKKEEIKFYSDKNYVQFVKSYADSTVLSFFYYAGENEIIIPIVLKLIGKPLQESGQFKISVVDEETTALPDYYKMPEKTFFKPGQYMDTVYLTLKNAPELRNREVRLVIELQEGEILYPGQFYYSRLIYRFSDLILKPEWWDELVEKSYLGKYSEKKFRYFMLATGVGIIRDEERDKLWALSLKFKYYLRKLKDEGRPVIEDNGMDMLDGIPVLG